MPTFMESVQVINAAEASVQSMFGGDRRCNSGNLTEADQQYVIAFVEAQQLYYDVASGRRPMYRLQEAMTTSDFPNLFADVLSRELLGRYQETTPVWQAFARRGSVPDFRTVKRFAVDGAEGRLSKVPEREQYPETPLTDSVDSYSVAKYGRRIDLSWEAMVNDDLDAFRSVPDRLARAARRTESFIATGLYVDANGPHASLYTSGNKNIVNATNAGGSFSAINPPLSISGLQEAMAVLGNQKDADGEPIVIESYVLVVPPALAVTAQNIVNGTEIWVTEAGGTTNQQLHAANWMRSMVTIQVDPYIPIVASSANGNASWFLFANPNTGRPALEIGFLRGYETPAIYQRVATASRVGGGGDAMEAFDDDSVAYKVRHVVGGTRLTTTGGAKATVASNGSGS